MLSFSHDLPSTVCALRVFEIWLQGVDCFDPGRIGLFLDVNAFAFSERLLDWDLPLWLKLLFLPSSGPAFEEYGIDLRDLAACERLLWFRELGYLPEASPVNLKFSTRAVVIEY